MIKFGRPGQRMLFSVVIAVLAATVSLVSWSADRTGIVILERSWTHSSRQVVPLAKDIARQNGLPVTVIDVEAQNAPDQARNFGIAIPSDRNEEAPWVYYVDRGKTVLLYSGRTYRPGYEDAARATILQRLQEASGR